MNIFFWQIRESDLMQRWNSVPIALDPKLQVCHPPNSPAGWLLQHTFRTGQAHTAPQNGISIHGFCFVCWCLPTLANHWCGQGHVWPNRPFLHAQRRERHFGLGPGPRNICGEAGDPGISVEALVLLRGSS